MISINTNLSSLIVQSSLKNSTNGVNKAIQRMTTGYKINGAKDNAAGHFISTSLSTKISAYQVAEDNVSMGLDMVQTASSSLSQMSDLASRLRSLATQASNGTYDKSSLASIDSEANAIVKELLRIQNTTSYNGINLLTGDVAKSNGGASGITTQSADVAVQSAAVQATSTSVRAGKSGFIEEVQKRDTSGMTSLASVDENAIISSGTYSISTAEELAKLATMTNNGKVAEGAEFVLASDIDLSAYSTGEGWTPIGNDSNQFEGIFDGNGYKVKNLYINRPNAGFQGLFGLTAHCSISNVALENVNVTGGNSYVGGLIGLGGSSVTLENCSLSGNVTGEDYVGGLVGLGSSTVTLENCSLSGNVTGTGTVGGLLGLGSPTVTLENCFLNGNVTGGMVGGLVGIASSSITLGNCYLKGDVNGGRVGGLVAYGINATISGSCAIGNISSSGSVGGLLGEGQTVTITNSYLKGDVNGIGCAGGLVANGGGTATISGSYVTGNVISGSSDTGGLLGCGNNVTISDSYIKGNVTGNIYIGGLLGRGNLVTIDGSYATGDVIGNTYIGGLIGQAYYTTTITGSYSIGNVNGNAYAGGLVGEANNKLTITDSYSKGDVTGQGFYVGGLVGAGYSEFYNSYSIGNVTGKDYVGGLVGKEYYGMNVVSNSYSAGNVIGSRYVGGLSGESSGMCTVNNSYSTASVTGSDYVGGLFGYYSNGTISNSYATGKVTGSDNVGGLIGSSWGTSLSDVYYIDKTGNTIGIGGGAGQSGTATKVTQNELNELISQGILPSYLALDLELSLQVGINGDSGSQIGLALSQIDLSSLDGLSMSNKNALDTIDEVLKSINEQQTNIGAAENRLMSALEQISVAYDNLVSTRSTIRDADIADESSNYIKMQILQQASATLLATANQNPSIALQLI